MSDLHPDITQEEYFLVVNRLKPITAEVASDGVIEYDGETPDEWFARNKLHMGEETAVRWFKEKAAKQALVEANKSV